MHFFKHLVLMITFASFSLLNASQGPSELTVIKYNRVIAELMGKKPTIDIAKTCLTQPLEKQSSDEFTLISQKDLAGFFWFHCCESVKRAALSAKAWLNKKIIAK